MFAAAERHLFADAFASAEFVSAPVADALEHPGELHDSCTQFVCRIGERRWLLQVDDPRVVPSLRMLRWEVLDAQVQAAALARASAPLLRWLALTLGREPSDVVVELPAEYLSSEPPSPADPSAALCLFWRELAHDADYVRLRLLQVDGPRLGAPLPVLWASTDSRPAGPGPVARQPSRLFARPRPLTSGEWQSLSEGDLVLVDALDFVPAAPRATSCLSLRPEPDGKGWSLSHRLEASAPRASGAGSPVGGATAGRRGPWFEFEPAAAELLAQHDLATLSRLREGDAYRPAVALEAFDIHLRGRVVPDASAESAESTAFVRRARGRLMWLGHQPGVRLLEVVRD